MKQLPLPHSLSPLVITILFEILLSILLEIHTHTQKSGIAGSYGSSFLILWVISVLCSIEAAYFTFSTVGTKLPISLHPCQHLVFSGFVTVAILIGVKFFIFLHKILGIIYVLKTSHQSTSSCLVLLSMVMGVKWSSKFKEAVTNEEFSDQE